MAKKRKKPKVRVAEAISLKNFTPQVVPNKRRLKIEQELDEEVLELIEEAFEVMHDDDGTVH